MKNWFKILLPVMIVLSGLVLGQKILNNKKTQPIKSGYSSLVSSIKEESVSKIVIKDGKGELTLSKNGQDWQANDGKKADGAKVKQLLSIILNPESDYELVSQNASRSEEFGLASTSASIKNIALGNSGQAFVSILVGNDSYPGTFIRLENQSDVYLTSQSLSSLITSDPQYFYESPKPTK